MKYALTWKKHAMCMWEKERPQKLKLFLATKTAADFSRPFWGHFQRKELSKSWWGKKVLKVVEQKAALKANAAWWSPQWSSVLIIIKFIQILWQMFNYGGIYLV